MENKYYYRIVIQNPETGVITETDIILDKEVSIYSIPQIAVDKNIIRKEDVNNISSVTRIKEKDSKALLYQAEQIVLKPRENYGTGKQFSHLMKDLQITDDEYTVMIDIGKITKDEITVVIYPNRFEDMEDMTKRTINQVIGIINLNSTKIVSVNYILSDAIENAPVDNDKNNTYNGPCDCDECTDECCGNCNNSLCEKYSDTNYCDCDDECCTDCKEDLCDECNNKCSCFKNPDLECCKTCDMSVDCGCYDSKTNRHEFNYTESKNLDVKSNEAPEKTLRIPIDPINPKEEIVMLANAIAKRLAIIAETDGKVIISVQKDLDGEIESSLRIKASYDVMCDL